MLDAADQALAARPADPEATLVRSPADPELPLAHQPVDPDPARMAAYRTALADWLACALAGLRLPTAERARGLGDSLDDRLIAVGTAGHVLDFDDTYDRGLTHLSAPLGPVVVVLGAGVGARLGDALAAFARGFEASAAFAAANHPELYNRGWHPTAVCGAVGAAITAGALLALTPAQEQQAVRLALLRSSGLRAAFGSDGKSLQVGFAAAAGASAARLAAAGARVGAAVADGPAGLPEAYGARLVLRSDRPAIDDNWIKAYPCCLQTHSAIEAAVQAAGAGVRLEDRRPLVVVHPVSRQAAALDEVDDGLQAKFSIPYLTAYSYLHGVPNVASFEQLDAGARRLARKIGVATDARLEQSAAVLIVDEQPVATVRAALGSPWQPMSPERHADKVADLGATDVVALLDDPELPIAELLSALS
jgi:2-methylcitrate dehydratase PrpD